MFRFSSEEGQELTVRHARSLTRFSNDHLHSHVLINPEHEGRVHYRKVRCNLSLHPNPRSQNIPCCTTQHNLYSVWLISLQANETFSTCHTTNQETIFSIFSIFLVDNLCWTVFIPIFPAFFRPQYGFLSVGLLFSVKPLAQLCMTPLSMTAVDNLGKLSSQDGLPDRTAPHRTAPGRIYVL